MMFTTSYSVTQDIHCVPLPSRPPTPILIGSTMRGSAPPSAPRMIPDRRITTRAPNSAPRADSASHSRHKLARKSFPGGAGFCQAFVAAVAINPDGGGSHDHPRRIL